MLRTSCLVQLWCFRLWPLICPFFSIKEYRGLLPAKPRLHRPRGHIYCDQPPDSKFPLECLPALCLWCIFNLQHLDVYLKTYKKACKWRSAVMEWRHAIKHFFHANAADWWLEEAQLCVWGRVLTTGSFDSLNRVQRVDFGCSAFCTTILKELTHISVQV